MPNSLSRTETLSLLAIFVTCVTVLGNTFQGDGEPLIAAIAFSGIAFSFTYSLIRWLGPIFIAAGLKGRDMSKVRKPEMSVKFETSSPCSFCMLIKNASTPLVRR